MDTKPADATSSKMKPDGIVHRVVAGIDDAPRLLTFNEVSPADAELIYDSLDKFSELERRHFKFSYNSVTRILSVALPTAIQAIGLHWLLYNACTWISEKSVPVTWRKDMGLMQSPNVTADKIW
ncbi:hypothetical protein ABW21_db0201305 [Orbilia brochopaga]|nr:hypothetical protein ABW21_db0201305 [Drechslerella brochopaga]